MSVQDSSVPLSTLSPGAFLLEGDMLMSPNQQYQLILQGDGNLVLYPVTDGNEEGQPLWASGTNGYYVTQAIMQADGNFVIYADLQESLGSPPGPGPVWASNTAGNPGSSLYVQNDGNVVIYSPPSPIWATNTTPQLGAETTLTLTWTAQ
jgi:hypothetical protein